MKAYVDNSATTVVTESVKDIIVKAMTEDYGNPSSLHMKGVEAEKYIKEAKTKIAKTLKVDEKMRALGFKRISSAELYDNNSTMMQKVFTFEVLALEEF